MNISAGETCDEGNTAGDGSVGPTYIGVWPNETTQNEAYFGNGGPGDRSFTLNVGSNRLEGCGF